MYRASLVSESGEPRQSDAAQPSPEQWDLLVDPDGGIEAWGGLAAMLGEV